MVSRHLVPQPYFHHGLPYLSASILPFLARSSMLHDFASVRQRERYTDTDTDTDQTQTHVCIFTDTDIDQSKNSHTEFRGCFACSWRHRATKCSIRRTRHPISCVTSSPRSASGIVQCYGWRTSGTRCAPRSVNSGRWGNR
jgi:hypothetical protein